MGWASYLEDIVERLNTECGRLRKSLEGGGKGTKWSEAEHRQQAMALLTQCENVVQQIERQMDIVTDPSMDLPGQVKELKLLTQNQAEETSKLKKDIARKEKQITGYKAALSEAETELCALEEEHEKLLALDAHLEIKRLKDLLGDTYKAFSTPNRIRTGKSSSLIKDRRSTRPEVAGSLRAEDMSAKWDRNHKK